MAAEKDPPQQDAAREPPQVSDAAELRRRAEEDAGFPETEDLDALSPEQIRRTFHELRVHQIELEMQNEELRRTQAELGAAQARYIDFYDLAPVGYLTLSEPGLILEANLTAATILGVTPDALVERPFTRFVLPEDQDLHYLHTKRLCETGAADATSVPQAGAPQAYELRMLQGDGTAFWAHLEVTAARDAGGAPVRRIVMSDITERKRAEEALRESEERYALTLDAVNDGLWDWNVQSGDALFSPRYYALLGYDDGEFPANYASWRLLVHPEDLARVEEELRLSIETGKGFAFDLQMKLKFGGWRWVSTRGRVVERDAAGKALRLVGTLSDITERKRAEEALRKLEERFRSMFAQAPLGIAFIDSLTGHIDEVNPRFAEIAGRSMEEMAIIDWMRITHPDDVQEDLDNMALLNAGKISGFHMEKRYLHHDGTPVWINMSIAPILVEDKAHPRHLCMIEDITERKHVEEKLAAVAAELERSNNDLEQFASIAAHDLQEPLRMVASYTQLLAERYEGQLDEKARKYIAYAVDGAVRMQRLVNDLLTYARVGTRGNPIEPTDAGRVLGQAIGDLATAIEESRAVVTHEELPLVRADASQLRQLFQNLLANALKFRSEEVPRVHVSARDEGRDWVFAVRDNGIGIDRQYAERVFVVFQRLHTRRDYPGTGIGLALCKRIVERHGGRIWFESEPGKGSTFLFTVPK